MGIHTVEGTCVDMVIYYIEAADINKQERKENNVKSPWPRWGIKEKDLSKCL